MVAEKTAKKFRGPLFSAAPCSLILFHGRKICRQVFCLYYVSLKVCTL